MDDVARLPRTTLAACCLPWDESGDLDEPLFRESVSDLAEQGFHDLYIFGTAGEGYAVDERLFDQVTDVFADQCRKAGARPMVGVISTSLRTVIGRIERCLADGVRSFQISLPPWGALNDRELATFFTETCGRFPEAEFLHYNLARGGRLVTPKEYAWLADAHPNLVAIKHTRADYPTVHKLFVRVPQVRHFFTEPAFSYASLIGPCGFLMSVAATNPAVARAFFEAGVAREAATLTTLAGELMAMGAHLHRLVGDGAHMDGAYDKVLAKVRDSRFPLRLLPPYEGASDEAFAQFSELLRERYPRWSS